MLSDQGCSLIAAPKQVSVLLHWYLTTQTTNCHALNAGCHQLIQATQRNKTQTKRQSNGLKRAVLAPQFQVPSLLRSQPGDNNYCDPNFSSERKIHWCKQILVSGRRKWSNQHIFRGVISQQGGLFNNWTKYLLHCNGRMGFCQARIIPSVIQNSSEIFGNRPYQVWP